MRGILIYILLLFISVNLIAQCGPTDPGMASVNASGNLVANANWAIVYGTPTCGGDIDASDGTRSIWTWAKDGVGECFATPYSFVAGRNYRICYRYRHTDLSPNGLMEVRTSNTSASTYGGVSSTMTLISSTNLNSTPLNTILIHSFTFTPSANQAFLVLRPRQDNMVASAEKTGISIDDVYVIDLDAPYTFTLSGGACIGSPNTVSVNSYGCETIDIYKDGNLLCSNCNSFNDTITSDSAFYSAEISRGIPGAFCDVRTIDTLMVSSSSTAPNSAVTSSSYICDGSSATLSASGCNTGTISWYTNNMGTGTPEPSSTVSPLVSTTYYSFCTEGGCKSLVGDSVTVMVDDTTKPVAICKDTTIYVSNLGPTLIDSSFINNNSTDNCGVQSIQISKNSFTCADVGSNSITLYVYDSKNNVDSCTAIVTVIDTIKPIISCRNITVSLDNNGETTITTSDLVASVSDNCGILNTQARKTKFTCADIGSNSVWVVTTDINGNVDSCQSTVIVQDTIPPTLVCLPNQTDTVKDATCSYKIIDYKDLLINLSDNCTSFSNLFYTQIPVPGTVLDLDSDTGAYIQNINIIVSDNEGLTATCSFNLSLYCSNYNLYVPNTFSPDADGINDFFVPKIGDGISEYKLYVFNKWGQAIYIGNQYDKPWDGTHNGQECKEDIYVWKIIYRGASNIEKTLFGHVTIIR